jgi:hypothetical protein
MICSTASGGWKNYHLAHEHMHIANLFLNKNGKLSFKFLSAASELWMLGQRVTSSFLNYSSGVIKH